MRCGYMDELSTKSWGPTVGAFGGTLRGLADKMMLGGGLALPLCTAGGLRSLGGLGDLGLP